MKKKEFIEILKDNDFEKIHEFLYRRRTISVWLPKEEWEQYQWTDAYANNAPTLCDSPEELARTLRYSGIIEYKK